MFININIFINIFVNIFVNIFITNLRDFPFLLILSYVIVFMDLLQLNFLLNPLDLMEH